VVVAVPTIGQTAVVPVIDADAANNGLMVAATDLRADKHPALDLAAAKYVVFAVMLGVVKLLPVPNTVVLVLVAYHSIVAPATAVDADIVTTPGPHLDAPVPVGVAGIGLTVALTIVLVEDTHVVPNLDSTK
jgi:hypothetical protein